MSYATYLEYTISPSPVTTGETQDLTIIGTLKTKAQLGVTLTSVTIKQIVLDFGTVGTGSTNLTDRVFSIGDIQTPENWTSTVSGVRCTLIPSGSAGLVTRTNALVFVIKSVPVNREQGNVTLTVSEAAIPEPRSGGEPPTTTPDDPGVESITLPKVAGSVTKPTLTAEPQIISPGGDTTMNWSGGNPDDTYELQYMSLEGGSVTTITEHADGSPLRADDQYPDRSLTPRDPELTLEETSMFILSYTENHVRNNVQAFVLVSGSLPDINTFEVLPDEPLVTLKWEVTDENPDASINVSFTMDPPDPNLYTASSQKTFSPAKKTQRIILTATDTTTGKRSEKSLEVQYGYRQSTVLSGRDFHFSNPTAIAIYKNYSYVANFKDNSLTVLKLSSPGQPEQVRVLEHKDYKFDGPVAITISENYAYVANQNGPSVTVLDLSEPDHPGLSVVLNDPEFRFDDPQDIVVAYNHMYVVNTFSITVFDLARPNQPALTMVVDDGLFQFNNCGAIAVHNHLAFVTNRNGNSVTVLDMSNPGYPAYRSLLRTHMYSFYSFNNPNAIAIIGNYAYVVNIDGDSISILDITISMNSLQVRVVNNSNFVGAYAITVDGNYAYVVNTLGDSIVALDVSDPVNPAQVALFKNPDYQIKAPQNITAGKDYLYVVNAEGSSPVTLIKKPVPPNWI